MRSLTKRPFLIINGHYEYEQNKTEPIRQSPYLQDKKYTHKKILKSYGTQKHKNILMNIFDYSKDLESMTPPKDKLRAPEGKKSHRELQFSMINIFEESENEFGNLKTKTDEKSILKDDQTKIKRRILSARNNHSTTVNPEEILKNTLQTKKSFRFTKQNHKQKTKTSKNKNSNVDELIVSAKVISSKPHSSLSSRKKGINFNFNYSLQKHSLQVAAKKSKTINLELYSQRLRKQSTYISPW